jgi:uncharacterized protein (DUF2336 family)
MSVTGQNSRFARLIDVENESSSERRRALLREVTEVFGDDEREHAEAKLANLDEVLSSVVSDFSREIRAELAAKIGPSKAPLGNTALKLALDEFDVARPILEHSTALSESHLLEVVSKKTQDHLAAVARRKDVSESVSHALVEKGDDRVVISLLENADAKIAHMTYEAVGDLALTRPSLHTPMVRHENLPVELLHDIYLEVEANLRREILARYDAISHGELDAALERSRVRLAKASRRPALEAAKAKARVEELRRRGELAPPVLIRLLREGPESRPTFIEAFAALAEVGADLVEKTVRGTDIDALAVLSRAAKFDRAVFVTLSVALVGSERRMGRVEEFGALYENVPVSAAQRAVRFWKVRTASAA